MTQHSHPVTFVAFTLAVCALALVIYTGFMMNRDRPNRSRNVPFFSRDPRLITAEGIKWRRRHYVAMFILASVWLVLALADILSKENARPRKAPKQQDVGLR